MYGQITKDSFCIEMDHPLTSHYLAYQFDKYSFLQRFYWTDIMEDVV